MCETPPGGALLREGPSRPSLFRIWTQRNCGFINNFDGVRIISPLANMDIQGCTSKYGVSSYVAPYITRRGEKRGPPFAYSDHIIGRRLARAVEENKTAQSDMARFFNPHLHPSIISQLEVCRVSLGIPRYIYARGFKNPSTKSLLNRVRTPEEVTADGRGCGAPFTNKSSILRYEARLRHASDATAPRGARRRPSSWGSSWALWIRPCSLFEWKCVVARAQNAYGRNSPSRVLG